MNKSAASLKGTVLSAVALSTLLMLAGSTPLAAQPTLTITLGSQETLWLDANACSAAGPRAAWLSFVIKNTGAVPANNVTAVFSGFTGTVGGLVQPSYFSAPFDTTRNFASIAAGAQEPVYFYVDYSPVCLHSLGGGSPFTGFTANYTLTVNATSMTTLVRNGTVTTGDLLTANAAGVAQSSAIAAGFFVGQLLNQTVTYSFGNNSDLFFQPAGDVGFDATCIRLVASEITAGTGSIPAGVIGLKDQLWFPTASTNASNNTLDLRYIWSIRCTNSAQTLHPWAAAKSGQKYKYTGFAASQILPAAQSSLTVTKTPDRTSDPVNTNGPVTWTVTFTNSASVPVYLSQINDTLPACMTINNSTASGSDVTALNSFSVPAANSGGTVSWIGLDRGNSTNTTYQVPANGSLLLKFSTNVSGCAVPGTYTNSVTGIVGSTTVGPATGTYVLGGIPGISLSKSANPTTYTAAGQSIAYTYTITNTGTATLLGPYSVTDNKIATVNCATGTLAPNATTTCTGNYVITAGDITAGSVTNLATANTTYNSSPVTSNQATATITANVADLAVSKGDLSATYTPGTDVTYTIGVTNSGPAANTGFTLTDTLPAGTSFASASAGCALAGNVVTCTSGGLAVSGSVSWNITLHVNASRTGDLVNIAAIATNNTVDPNTANNSASDLDTQASRADLAVTKTDGSATYTPGNNVAYTIGVTNNGPSDNAGFTLTDTLPAGTSFVSASTGCVLAASTVTCTSNGLANGASLNWTITLHVDSSRTGALLNTAGIATNATPDPNTANDSAGDNDTAAPSADLAVTKTDGSLTYTAGNNVAYTIGVTNNGPSDNAGFTLTDTLPAGTSFVSASTGCVLAASTVTCTSNGLANGASLNWTITLHVDSSKTGALLNTAGIATNATPDPNSANDSAGDNDTAAPSADLAVTKTDGSATYTPGNNVSYTITVTNNGPSDNAGFTLADALPVGTSFVSASPACVLAATTVTCTSNGLANGASVNWTITLHVNSSLTGTLVNNASIATNTTNDPVPGNNSASDTDNQASIVDLSVTKTDGATVYIPGSNVVYSIVVANAGPSNAIGATVVDTLPSNIGATTWTASAAGGATGFTASGSGAINDTVNVPSGGTITYLVTVAVPLIRTGTLVNSVTVNAPVGTTDSNPANNTATDTDNAGALADLSLTKDDGQVLYTPGTDVAYTITVTNQGPAANTGFTVTDVLPSGTTFVSAPGCSFAGNTVTCTSAGLPLNGAALWTVTVHTDANRTGCLTNTAIIATSNTADVNQANNSSTDSDYAQPTTALSAGLGLVLGYPAVTGNNTSVTATTYTAATQLFKVDSTPTNIRFTSTDLFHTITGSPTLALRASVSNTGVLLGGVSGNDLTLTGTTTDQFAVTYTGTLLTGEIVAFGSRDIGTTDRFELRFVVTGGLLASQFAGKEIGVVIAAENSTFTNSFAVNFNSTGKFSLGSVAKVCPIN